MPQLRTAPRWRNQVRGFEMSAYRTGATPPNADQETRARPSWWCILLGHGPGTIEGDDRHIWWQCARCGEQKDHIKRGFIG